MQLTFLRADMPLAKSFTMRNGVLEKSPYPNAYLFTSRTVDIETLEDLYTEITVGADAGECLLKGEITRELTNEPRAGTTGAESGTSWVCFDLDGIDTIASVDEFMETIGLGDVSYMAQYSASMGVADDGLRAHIFVLLSGPVAAPFLKQWLISLNLQHPALTSQIKLTRTGAALRWPLDITTCQNDKLIYIAPPTLGAGVVDTFKGKRIQLVKRDTDILHTSRIKADVHKNRSETKKILDDLRTQHGYSKIKDSQYKIVNGISYLAKPGEAVITGIKEERGFVYFNLNGGDSWGYYHPDNNPEFIYNFKGEPAYKTEDLLPEYWKGLKAQSQKQAGPREYFILRDFRTDRLYNGYYDIDQNEVVIARAANETRLKSFLKQHGQPVPDFVPDWDLCYDPTSDVRYDAENKRINMYRPSLYYNLKTKKLAKAPAMFKRVVESAVGTGETYEHFINWLAYIVQFRKMTQTAWVLHGNQGTGKGVLFHRVITPLLGMHNVHAMLGSQLAEKFNSYLEKSLVVFVDEVQMSQLDNASLVNASVKNWIVEPTVSIRPMHGDMYKAPNHCNFIFASNQPDPAVLEQTDRRYNVGNFQRDRLELSESDLHTLDSELEDIFMYLMTQQVDEGRVRQVLDNDDRKLLISINQTSVEGTSDAIINGDLEWLLDQLPSSDDPIFMTPGAAAYRHLMEQLLINRWDKLSRDELFIIYDYVVGNMPRSSNKFTSLLKHHRIYTRKLRRGDQLFYGVDAPWQHDEDWFAQMREQFIKKAGGKIVELKKRSTV